MAGSGEIRAGRAFVEMFVKDEKLQQGLARAQAKLRAFAAGTAQIGRQLFAVAAVIGLPLIAGSKVFADFESQMAQVATLLDEPAAHMAKFNEAIREMQKEFGESSEALAGGLYDILSASVPAEKALEVLAVSARAAKAGITDTKTAADAITTVLNSYGLGAEHAADVSDLLFAIVKRGKTTFAELAPAIGNVASLASSAGVGLEEMGAVLATLTRNGVQTDNAVTALTAIISSFLKPEKEAAELARQLGFEMNSATIQSEGLEGVFKRIAQLPPEVVAKLFPNIRALRGVIPALKNMEGLADDIAAMANRAGETEAAYAKLAATVKHQFNQMKEAVIVALSKIGEALAGNLTEATQKIKSVANAAAEWIGNNKELVVTLAKVAAVVGTLGVGLLAMGQIAGAAASTLGLATIAVKALGVAFTLLAANPVVLTLTAAAVAIGVLGYALYKTTHNAAELSDATRRLREENDKLRALDQQRLTRLEQLASKEKLSNSEMKEAQTLIDALNSRYQGLGLSLDETTGKILGLAQAQGVANQAMRDSAIADLRAEIKETEQNVAELAEEAGSFWAVRIPGMTESLARQTRAQLEQLRALHQRLKALGEGNIDAISGRPVESAQAVQEQIAVGVQDATPSEQSLEHERDLANRIYELKLAQIEDEEKRAILATRHRYANEISEAQKAGLNIASLQEAAALEEENIRKEFADRRVAEEKRAAEELAEAEKDLAYEIAALKIKAEKDGMEERLALLDLEKKKALEDAKEMGLDLGKVRQKFDLERKIVEADQDVKERESRITTQGTFSARSAARLGGNRYESKSLGLLGDLVDGVKKVEKAVKNGGVAFGA